MSSLNDIIMSMSTEYNYPTHKKYSSALILVIFASPDS